MNYWNFPPIENADESGLLAIGGDLKVSTLLSAYTKGIFPWPISKNYPLAWFSPEPRGILTFENLKIPKSLKKVMRRSPYQIKFNSNFESVIRHCASSSNRKDQDSTWITEEMIQGYISLHEAKYAYSIEAYDDQNTLVGGLYGIVINSFISGESMFYLKSNASKITLIELMNYLHSHQINWIDTQMVTPIVRSLGGSEVTRRIYAKMLKKSLNIKDKKKLFT
jgi:leucyl/phenylalanyl-tRNA--protein transferase